MSLIAELKRRNVYRAAVFYAASAWLLVQVATQVFPLFHIAEWVMRWIVVAAVVGFPFAVAFAWFYEWTPEGLKRESDVAPDESITHHTGKKLDRWIIAVLGAAVVLLLTDRFVLHKDANVAADNSIAVLPLVNESGDANDEYFSDGLSEDLINALTQLNGLRVISRNSSFQFKGKSGDPQSIGSRLGVNSLLEGTVRKLGNRLRISAALIHAADGSQVWAQTFDREYKDIFDVQAEIAQAVAQALRIRLLGDTPAAIVSQDRPPDGNLQAYEAYLQGNFYYDHITKTDFHKAIEYYRQAVKLEPRYALALARLSLTWTELAGQIGGAEQSEAYANGRVTAQQALVLEPNLAKAHDALGWLLLSADWNLAGAQAEFVKAEALAPDDAFAKNGLAAVLSNLGRQEEAVAMQRRAVALDPLHSHYRVFLGGYLVALGRLDEAEASLRKGLDIQPGELGAHAQIVEIQVLRGDAASALREAELEQEPSWKHFARALALFASGDRTAADTALQELINKDAEESSFQIAAAYAYRREADKAFEWLDQALIRRDGGTVQLLADPFLMSFRSDPRYAAFCRKIGLPVPGEQSAPAAQAEAPQHKP
jgi:TolB-like protein/Flp pilus assembly protein TadD